MGKEYQEELHDEETVDEETHDMEKAEVQSVKSVDKTDNGIKQAPMRRGDKRNPEKMPKGKAAKVGALYDKINLLAKEDVEKVYEYIMGERYLSDEGEYEVTVEDLNYEEDLDALIESEGTLSVDFKKNAGAIFESALNYRVKKEVERIEEAYVERFEEEISEARDSLIESVDSYLNYAVETFMEENKLAIQSGLRTEVAETFMTKLKDLFEESYIEVPESKIDLVDELADQVEELEEALNDSTAKQIQMSEELEMFKRSAIVLEHIDGLSETQASKLVDLSESLSFDSEEDFEEKVIALKETHFKVTTKGDESIVEENDDDGQSIVETNDRVAAYNRVLSRTKY